MFYFKGDCRSSRFNSENSHTMEYFTWRVMSWDNLTASEVLETNMFIKPHFSCEQFVLLMSTYFETKRGFIKKFPVCCVCCMFFVL